MIGRNMKNETLRVRLKENPVLSARPYGTAYWILEDLNKPHYPGVIISKEDFEDKYEVVR